MSGSRTAQGSDGVRSRRARDVGEQREGRGGVRVLDIPADHPYVGHTRPTAGDIVSLPDPTPPGARWAPSPALTGAWVRAHADELDVVHLHFGFESRTSDELADWVEQLRRAGIALVHTVHDLQHPHLVDQRPHEAALEVIVPASAALVTLTRGAAAEIGRRWGREAIVLRHPHVADLSEVGAPRPTRHDPPRVGVHLKSLRANCGGAPFVAGLTAACAELHAHLIIDIHDEVRRPGFARADPALVELLDQLAAPSARRPGVEVRWRERMSDAALLTYLRGLEVSVVPHRWGTHSGWRELCRDVGTAVLAPDVGHLAEQRPEGLYRWQGEAPEPCSLRAGLQGALHGPLPITREERVAGQQHASAELASLYRCVVGR